MPTSPLTPPEVSREPKRAQLHYDLECLATGRIMEDEFDPHAGLVLKNPEADRPAFQIGRASCRERV